ncbi:hypothetical protein [Bifidobacterium crudilactis]|jgi:hypothetical protein|uniref:hypothetical protein n=1 Tax=Bifidobacterium crudilactis TaxID=327277 RepID=UPI002352F82C|nr:hypothetical protein [Bifidobacterium crudilactis]MCI1218547.1 hypothetical protein [Bifidobacterium crudilactis]
MTDTSYPVQGQDFERGYKARNIRAVVGQYLTEKQYSILIPIEILVLYWVVSAVIVLLMGIKAGLPLPVGMQNSNAGGNIGAVFCFPYFLIVAGALCVNRQFNAAMSFGSTRRDFWLGTMLGFLCTSMSIGVFTILGLAVEQLSGHWWFGVHAFDVAVLGSGNYAVAFFTVFILSMTSLLAGATYGTVFRSFGSKSLTISLICTVLVLLGLLAIVIWQSTAIVGFFATWGVWTVGGILSLACVAMAVTGYFVNQHATV